MKSAVREILGIEITIRKKKKILEEIRKYLSEVGGQKSEVRKNKINPLVIFTPNPEIILYSQRDAVFKGIVNSGYIKIPDGNGVCWALRKMYQLKVDRISGVDLMSDLVKMSSEKGYTVGLIGGRDGVALKTAECLRKIHLGIKIEILRAPEIKIQYKERIQNTESRTRNKKIHNSKFLILNSYRKPDLITERYFNNLVKEIVEREIDMLFVGLGHPKQEYFINSIKYKVLSIKYERPLVLMAVGGSFDYISGRIPRAPRHIRNKGLEWLFRLIIQPWRIKRQTEGAKFFYLIWKKSKRIN